MRSTFIKTIVVSYWKQLNLSINNKKLINLEDISSLLLATRILSSTLLCVTFYLNFVVFTLCLLHCISGLIFCLCVSYVLHLLPRLSPLHVLYIASLVSSLAFTYLMHCISYFISRLCVSCMLCFLRSLSPPHVLCVMSLDVSLAFRLVCCVSYLVSRFVSYALRLLPCLSLVRF